MKNLKFFLLVLLTCITMFSCSEDQSTSTKPETTSVSLVVETTSKTSKNVNRVNSIPVWVKAINVTAASTVWNYSKSETFDLVSSGGENGFKIDDVAVGLNNFTASTTSYDANKLYQVASITPTGSNSSATTANNALTTMKNKAPFAVYNGTKTGVNIANNAVNNISIDMNTQNGRIISAFILANDPALRANTFAVVTITTDAGTSPLATAQIKNNVATFEWSDDKAINGKVVTYTVTVYDDTAPNLALKTYTITRAIVGSTSYSCIYIIDRDKIINSKEDILNFVFQKWNETDCFDVYNDDGDGDDHGDDDDYNCEGYNKQGFDKCGWSKGPNSVYDPKYDRYLQDGNSKAKCQ